MKVEAKMKKSPSEKVVQFIGKDVFLDEIRDTSNEISQMEELRKHAEKMKGELLQYLTTILKKYDLEIKVTPDLLDKKNQDNIKALSLNQVGILSFSFIDGTEKSLKLEDYPPDELMKILELLTPSLKEAIENKRKEYENVSNRLGKIGHYFNLFKDKIKLSTTQI
jgi:hypothetical protein